MPVTTNLPRHIQTDNRSFVRETSSHALLNTDAAALHSHRRKTLQAKTLDAMRAQVDSLNATVARLEQSFDLIFKMQRDILTHLSK